VRASLTQSQRQAAAKQSSAATIKYAYVTFRDMDHADRLLEAFNVQDSYRCLVNYCCCCCMRGEQRRVNEKYFHGRWLYATKASEPEGIHWANLGVGKTSRNFRSCIVQLFCLIVILGGLYGMVRFKVESDKLTADSFDTQVICPVNEAVEQIYAASEYDRGNTGPMYCFCEQEAFESPFTFQNIEFGLGSDGKMQYHCYDWVVTLAV
jgi:hypothetical protein